MQKETKVTRAASYSHENVLIGSLNAVYSQALMLSFGWLLLPALPTLMK
jgi:hypothetical protein